MPITTLNSRTLKRTKIISSHNDLRFITKSHITIIPIHDFPLTVRNFHIKYYCLSFVWRIPNGHLLFGLRSMHHGEYVHFCFKLTFFGDPAERR